MTHTKRKKVAVGMSGGVDSSVAAALLLEQGYEVIGVFMHFWTDPHQKAHKTSNKCCSVESFMDARRVCQKLGIPIYSLNYSEKFKETVVDNFIDEYKKGRTPNPCVRCNQSIKTGGFIEQALELGCDYVATGHYAKTVVKDGVTYLLEGNDPKKDQSYFLYRLTQKHVSHLLFPLGEMTKDEVRKEAKRFGLPVASKHDSQEICFVAGSTHNDFLKRHIAQNPGPIVDMKGKELGEHQGLTFYTIGQRKGIKLSGGPYFVVAKDEKKNALIVTDDAFDARLYVKEIPFEDVTWTVDAPESGKVYSARIRYLMKKAPCTIEKGENGYIAHFEDGLRGVSSGQSLVLYDGDKVVGGGIIQ